MATPALFVIHFVPLVEGRVGGVLRVGAVTRLALNVLVIAHLVALTKVSPKPTTWQGRQS